MQLTTLPSARDPKATGGNRTHNLRFTKPLHYRCATVASLREPITIRPAKIADKTSAIPHGDFTAAGNLGVETTSRHAGFSRGAYYLTIVRMESIAREDPSRAATASGPVPRIAFGPPARSRRTPTDAASGIRYLTVRVTPAEGSACSHLDSESTASGIASGC